VEEDCFCHANNVWDPAVSRVGWISVAVGDFGAAHTTNGERKAIARTGKGKTAKDQLFLSLRDLTSRSPVTVCACGLTPIRHQRRYSTAARDETCQSVSSGGSEPDFVPLKRHLDQSPGPFPQPNPVPSSPTTKPPDRTAKPIAPPSVAGLCGSSPLHPPPSSPAPPFG
jgi:hypothetical protein